MCIKIFRIGTAVVKRKIEYTKIENSSAEKSEENKRK
jgi:hypothetical protein